MAEMDLKQIGDTLAIQKLMGDYCRVSDAAIYGEAIREEARALFTEDFQGDYGFGPIEGRDAMLDYTINGAGQSMDQMWHSVHTPRITIDGDTAVGHWTAIVRMIAKGQTEPGMIFGRYLMHFRREGDGWRVARVQFGPEKIEL